MEFHMAKIFVSYSRKDIEFAKRLTAELQKSDLDFWIDWEGIPPTVDWWREIEKGIEEADVFLFLISPDSAKSRVCGQEIDTAVKNAKRIIPIVVRDVRGDEAPNQLSHLNWIFFRENDDCDVAVEKLITAIETDYEWAATHRRLQVKALDWERNGKDSGFFLRGMDLQDAEHDLATNTSKDPHPTDLQREYVLGSRRDTSLRQRQTLADVTIALIISIMLGVIAFFQRQEAVNQAKISRSQTLAVDTQLNKDKVTSNLLLGIESLNLVKEFPYRDRVVAEQALRDSLSKSWKGFDLTGHETWISDIAFSPNGHWLGTASDAIRLWDMTNPSTKPLVLQGNVSELAFSPDGQWLAGPDSNRIVVWDLENPLAKPEGLAYDRGTEVSNISFSSDSGWMAYLLESTSPDGTLHDSTYLWNTKDRSTSPIVFDWERSPVFSPDGQKLATTGYDVDGYTVLRDLNDLSSAPTILHETGEEIDTLVFSPDGSRLATTNYDNVVKVWDLNDSKAKPSVLPTDQSYIKILTFSPDNRLVVAGSSKEIRFWKVNNFSGDPFFILSRDEDPINALAFSPDNQWLAIGSSTNAVQIMDTNNLSLDPILLHAHTRSVQQVVFSSDGQGLATVSIDNTARLWKMIDPLTEPVMLRRYDDQSASMATTNDGKWIASGNNNVRLWNLTKISNDPVLLPGYKGDVAFLSFSPDGHWLATGNSLLSDTNNVVIWDITKPKNNPFVLKDAFTAKFSPDNQWLASRSCQSKSNYGASCEKGELHLLDLSDPSAQSKLMESYETRMGDVVFSTDGHWLATWDDNKILIWNMKDLKTEPVFREREGTITTLAFSPDGQWLATGSCINRTKDNISCKKTEFDRWDLTNFSAQSLLIQNDGDYLYDAVFTSNSRWLAARDTNDVVLWDMKNWADKPVTLTSDGAMTTFAFSPDSQFLAGGSDDRTLRVWELNNLQANPGILRGHESTIYEIAFSPNSHWLASGILDNLDEGGSSAVRLWNMENLSAAPVILRFQRVIDDEVSITFNPDGQFVITGTNPIRIWRLSNQSLLEVGCQIAGRNFTRAEWTQYFPNESYPTDPQKATCPQWPLANGAAPGETPIP
jgi:WD40 repeat protein